MVDVEERLKPAILAAAHCNSTWTKNSDFIIGDYFRILTVGCIRIDLGESIRVRQAYAAGAPIYCQVLLAQVGG